MNSLFETLGEALKPQKIEVIAMVKFNQSEAFVLNKEPELIYTKYNGNTIIGTDGIFYELYGYERPDDRWKAFGGRKFDLTLSDGTIEKCSGQWWSTTTETAKKVLNISESNKLYSVTACSIASLRRCYVFHGYTGLQKPIEELRASYTGKVYDYREFEQLLKV